MPEENKTDDKPLENQNLTLIQKAIEAAQRIENANKKMEELIKKQEEITSINIMGGRSEAGLVPKQLTEEEKLNLEVDKFKRIVGLKQ